MAAKKKQKLKIIELSNRQVAAELEQIADLLRLQAGDAYRIGAYRRAAAAVRASSKPLAEIFAEDGVRGLEKLPAVGRSISKRIAQMLRNGKSQRLKQLLKKAAGPDLLTTLPSVGPRLAERMEHALGTAALDDVFVAAFDGRLRQIAGLGRKRVAAIRESLAARLDREPPRSFRDSVVRPPAVAELLAIDADYRRQAAEGRLLRVAPLQFNPTGAAWLPILRTEREGRRYTAHFANTAASHRLGHTHDWVVIYCQDKQVAGQWTVVTATLGPLGGKRIVRGREPECREYYGDAKPRQLTFGEEAVDRRQ